MIKKDCRTEWQKEAHREATINLEQEKFVENQKLLVKTECCSACNCANKDRDCDQEEVVSNN